MMSSLRARNWRSLTAGAAVVTVVVTLFIAAFLADGRAASESETNDGGAWMVNRSEGSIGHLNRVVEEFSSSVVGFSGEFDVDQSSDVVLVSDPGTEQVSLIASSRSATLTSVAVGPGIDAVAAPGAVVFVDGSSGRVWRVSTNDLGAMGELSERGASIQSEGPVKVSVSRTGEIAAAYSEAAIVRWLDLDGVESTIATPDLAGATLLDMTIVGDRVVVLTDDGRLVVVRPGGGSATFELEVTPSVLQQPGPLAETVVAVTADGRVIEIDLDSGETEVVRELEGSAPLSPIVHGGCTHVVTIEPAPAYHFCDRTEPLTGAGNALRLRLVNDWVWVNDVANGAVWLVDREVELRQLDSADWQTVLPQDDAETEEQADEGGADDQIAAPDADDITDDLDQVDDDQDNTDPVAEDDLARTRRTRPIVVDVLANDTDEDNDPLTVSLLSGLDERGLTPQGIAVSITADGRAVQVTPNGSYVGDTTFDYRVSDGRGGAATATVTVTIVPDDVQRPPEPVRDSGTVRAGRSVSMNVLTNDSDPDGDPLTLLDVQPKNGEEVGVIAFAPDGEVTFTPDVTRPEGRIELEYVVSDDSAMTAVGLIQIDVRPAESNQKPLARSDLGRTVVGSVVQIDVLENDSDPDGDPLTAVGLTAVEPQGVVAQLTPQGEFLFVPAEAGVYRFVYGASDRQQVAQAQIRVDVEAPPENRPPIPVVDEVALAIGETRLVRVLDNDGDPDGDVVGIVDNTEAEGLEIDEVPGVGFRITALDNADPRVDFQYWISDGRAGPVSTSVIVTTLRRDRVDYRPVARPDTFSVRPGRTSRLPVLLNDYDPEGGALAIASVEEIPDGLLRVAPDGQTLLLTVPEDQEFGFGFTYDVVDEGGSRASAVVRIDMIAPGEPNRPPIAAPDVVRTIEGRPVTISVVDNDSDPDSDYVSVLGPDSQPRFGDVSLTDDGSLLYTPLPGFAGTDRFTYILVDDYDGPGGPAVAIGQVSVGVMPLEVNRRPVANDDIGNFDDVAIGTDGPIALPVLANDDDPDGDPIAVVAFSELPEGAGMLTEATGGAAILYTPPASGEPQRVSFTYRIGDPGGLEDTAQVAFDLVQAAEIEPEPPVAVDDVIRDVAPNAEVTFDPRTNDVNNTGTIDELRVAPSPDGRYTVAGGGTAIVVAPLAESAEILYRVVDAGGRTSAPAVIRVDVRENRPPVVSLPEFETIEGEELIIAVHDYVEDPDDDPLSFNLGGQRLSGEANADVSPGRLVVTFRPAEGSGGSVGGFDFEVDDGVNPVRTESVRITILREANTPPVASDIERTVEAGVDAIFLLPDHVEDEDLESGSDSHDFEISDVTGPIVADRRGGTVTVSSAFDAGGATGSFRYTVTDESGESDSATVTVLLAEVDDPAPDVDNEDAESLGDPVTVDVLAGHTSNLRGDTDGLVVADVGPSPDGETSTDGRTVTFTPAPGFAGAAEFTFTVQDGRRSDTYQTVRRVFVDVIREPAAPQPPVIDRVSGGEVTLTWAPPADSRGAEVLQYRIEYVTAAGGSGTFDTTGPSTSYTWRGLTNAVVHQFNVRARNRAGWGDPSALSLPATPDTVPEAPGVPSVVDHGDGELLVRWEPARSQGSPVREYIVDMRCGSGRTDSDTTTATEIRFTGLTNGDACAFQAIAVNDAVQNDGRSEPSGYGAQEYPSREPGAPGAPTGTRGDQQVAIVWAIAGDDGGDPVDHYQWRMRPQGGSPGPWSGNVPASGQTIAALAQELTNGVAVQFQARAHNRDGYGAESTWSTIFTPCGAPDAPGSVRAVFGDREIEIRWAAPDDQGCAISNYRVRAGGRTWAAGPGATSVVADGLINGTPYTFTVEAQNEEGWSDPGGPVTETPAGRPLRPAPPTCTQIADGQVRCTWEPADGNGRPITHYVFSSCCSLYQGSGLEYVTVGLPRGAPLTFTLRANNIVGQSVPNDDFLISWTLPGTPTVSASAGNGSVSATWNTPSTGGTPILEHRAQLVGASAACGSGSSRTSPGSPESWSASNGTSYRVCVQYRNAVGWSDWGRSNPVTPQAPPPPPPPPSPTITITRSTGTWFAVSLANFSPRQGVTLTCRDSVDPQGFYTESVTVSSTGSYSDTQLCFTSDGPEVWVTSNTGVRSNTIRQ